MLLGFVWVVVRDLNAKPSEKVAARTKITKIGFFIVGCLLSGQVKGMAVYSKGYKNICKIHIPNLSLTIYSGNFEYEPFKHIN